MSPETTIEEAAPRTKRNGNAHHLPIIATGAPRQAIAPAGIAINTPELVAGLIKDGLAFRSAQQQIDILAQRNRRLRAEVLELREKEAQAVHLAYHDGLTGLPNRRLLRDRFHQALGQAERRKKPLAFLMLDLDEFKWVNDTLGHAVGDKLLQVVGARLTAAIRDTDTACRYGGDEFALMLPDIDSPAAANEIAAKIRAQLGEPYVIDRSEIRMSASIGTAVYPTDARTCGELIAQADMAMYRTKPRGHQASILTLLPYAKAEAPCCEADSPLQPI